MANWQKLMGRREFLVGTGLAVATVPIVLSNLKASKAPLNIVDDPSRSFQVSGKASLGERARAKGLIYGAFPSVGYKTLTKENSKLQSAFVRECALLVGGFYWDVTRPTAHTFDFRETDTFAQFARTHNKLFRGHPLVWNQLFPQWLTEKFQDRTTRPQELEAILVHHISTVVNRYQGQVHSWDVVNEVIWPEDRKPQGLRRSPWLKFLGETYIDLAFHVARAADPQALLVLNGDRLEHDTPDDEARRVATLKLLERLVANGTPVQALGIQSHLHAGKPFNSKQLRSFLQDVASLGLKILITELDVDDSALPADILVRDRIVAATYEDFLSIVLDEPAVIAVITWGLSDNDTWLFRFPRKDNLPIRSLPWDDQLNRKLAWNAIARAFDRAPQRSPAAL